ncbi:hypothetical protein CAPTEDRAFT_220911 [Capitella teleta]|uniref:PH domain-containing protein n=1 Tax=Capitella teleta TaxID=283909 RepID=R7TRH4_CAPTE|nr:hypothetical protein CAPTEDRAFT_220911 [Capitella teleta]|eukprot:ELT93630.1 hypothetical protein CAPTEDRAFT_220911 [Capitella teleta]
MSCLKLSGKLPLKFIKWRRRFFVLHSPPAADSLPGTRAALDYFDNENLKHRIGSIDLDHTEEIQSNLDSSFYQHVFSIQSKHKGKSRTYYLVADTLFNMNKWVDCLCLILKLKENQEDKAAVATPTPQPPPSAVQDIRQLPQPQQLQHERLTPSPPSPREMDMTTTLDDRDTKESYIPIWDCESTPTTHPLDQVPPAPRQRVNSVVSLPDEPAPPPPSKTGNAPQSLLGAAPVYDHPSKSYVNLDDNENVYKFPQSCSQVMTEAEREPFYKVPPSQYKGFIGDQQRESVYSVPPPAREVNAYDVPPSRRVARTSRSSEDSQPPDSGWESSDTYDKPPRRYDVDQVTEQMRVSTLRAATQTYYNMPQNQDVYDSPRRKTLSEGNILAPAQDRSYINLRSLNHVPPPALSPDSMYDIPPSHDLPPPPQPCTSTRLHHYKNAPPGVLGQTESVYMPMGQKTPSVDEVYMPMGSSQQIYTAMDTTSIYSAPPPSRPIDPPPTQDSSPQQALRRGADGFRIFCNPTHRTRSFKRPPTSVPVRAEVVLPTRLRTGNTPDSSSDEDDDMSDSSSVHKSAESIASSGASKQRPSAHSRAIEPHLPPKGSLGSTPPPPKKSSEVQYLSLDLDKSGADPERSPASPRSPQATDYKEIDFVKTKALGEMKKDLENRRKSSERSIDE